MICFFLNVDKWFVSEFEVSALDDGVFPRSVVQKLAFVWHVVEIDIVRCFEYCIIKVLMKITLF